MILPSVRRLWFYWVRWGWAPEGGILRGGCRRCICLLSVQVAPAVDLLAQGKTEYGAKHYTRAMVLFRLAANRATATRWDIWVTSIGMDLTCGSTMPLRGTGTAVQQAPVISGQCNRWATWIH